MNNAFENYPNREVPNGMVPVEEYNKLSVELEKTSARLKIIEKRNNLFLKASGFLPSVSKFLLFAAIISGLGYGIYWTCFKGSAYGSRSRHNAEVQAMSFVNRLCNNTAINAVCTDDTNQNYKNICFVNTRDLTGDRSLTIVCDDDEIEYNDGCNKQ